MRLLGRDLKRRSRFKVYLDSGAVLSVRAHKMSVSYSSVDGEVSSWKVEDSKGAIPVYISPKTIIAVTERK